MNQPSSAADLLRAAMDAHGVTDPELRAGIAALVGGETGFRPRTETGYAHTKNDRVRAIFGARVAALTDPQLDELKADEPRFFERVYGGAWGAANLGNTEPGDGYRFRGRTGLQLTGRANYRRYGARMGIDLETDPDRANEPKVSAELTVIYMLDRYKGGGWEGMKRAVGNSFGDVDATKNALFRRYLASGEFAAKPTTPEPKTAAVELAILRFVEASTDLQNELQLTGDYRHKVDGDWGERSRAALAAYRKRNPTG